MLPCPVGHYNIKPVMTTTLKKIRAPKGQGFKLKAGVPLNDQQITMFVNHYKTYKSFPGSKIPCNITGKLTTAVGPWLRKKVAEFGSAEALLRGYKCREVLKSQRIVAIGKQKKSKHREVGVTKEEGRYDIPSMDSFVKPSLYDPAKESESNCLRPDIFLSNDRHCDGCKYYKICRSRLKNLPKHINFDGEKFVYSEEPKKKK
jgi:hypothetical protein